MAPRCVPQCSKFKWRDLVELSGDRSEFSQLSVVAHIDVNAFFAQVEQLRLGLSKEDPLVCVQWSSIIAVSYSARKYGINRMDTLESALSKCEGLKVGHTAVFKKGQSDWSYIDYLPSPKDHKVSLDPYRRESRKIMRIFKLRCSKVEKASVDESFLDLGNVVFQKLLELFPVLKNSLDKSFDDYLPEIPEELPEGLDFRGEVIRCPETDDQDGLVLQDWDDIVMLLASMEAHDIRKQIEKALDYTTSCGIGRVKTIAKLASGLHKPDNQTIIRNCAIDNFLYTHFKFTDFWGIGPKTSGIIKQRLLVPEEDSIGYIKENFTQEELELKLKDPQLATRLYQLVRGLYQEAINTRIDIKSMGSNKNFRGKSVNSVKDLTDWLPVFVGDLIQRLTELDEEQPNCIRRPKTVAVHLWSWNGAYSKQCTVPKFMDLSKLKEVISHEAEHLIKTFASTFDNSPVSLFPLRSFSLNLTSFEVISSKESIDKFVSSSKRNREEHIDSLFKSLGENTKSKPKVEIEEPKNGNITTFLKTRSQVETATVAASSEDPQPCPQCGSHIPEEEMVTHKDWHYAMELQKQLETETQPNNQPHTDVNYSPTSRKKAKLDKNQTRLPFFK
ncbi:hypothetical protein LJB42_001809 [Komagataella kurtzmanii]|nr:hypothetical protein LJB42_001809 [Komagataella kurtzmanii]